MFKGDPQVNHSVRAYVPWSRSPAADTIVFCKSLALPVSTVLTEHMGFYSLFFSSFSREGGCTVGFSYCRECVVIERRRVRPLLRPQKHVKMNKNPFRRTPSIPEERSTPNPRQCACDYPAVMPCDQNLDPCGGERQEMHTNSTGHSSPLPHIEWR